MFARFDPGLSFIMSTKDQRLYGRNSNGRIRMPGGNMTKAGKLARMRKDFNRASPRKGKRR